MIPHEVVTWAIEVCRDRYAQSITRNEAASYLLEDLLKRIHASYLEKRPLQAALFRRRKYEREIEDASGGAARTV